LSWSSIAFFWLIRRLYLACNSEAVMPAKEGSRALRRAPCVSERIRATKLSPMPGSLSQWVSGILATSQIEGGRPPNSDRIACLTLGGSSSSGKGSSSRNDVLGSCRRDIKMLPICEEPKRNYEESRKRLHSQKSRAPCLMGYYPPEQAPLRLAPDRPGAGYPALLFPHD
jgi:hypothetical protein